MSQHRNQEHINYLRSLGGDEDNKEADNWQKMREKNQIQPTKQQNGENSESNNSENSNEEQKS